MGLTVFGFLELLTFAACFPEPRWFAHEDPRSVTQIFSTGQWLG